MTARERLHRWIDTIPESEVERLVRSLPENKGEEVAPELASLFDFMDHVAANAPQEDLDRMSDSMAENHDRFVYGTTR